MSKVMPHLFNALIFALFLLPLSFHFVEYNWITYPAALGFYSILLITDIFYFIGAFYCKKEVAIEVYFDRKPTQRIRIIEYLIILGTAAFTFFATKYDMLPLIMSSTVLLGSLTTIILKKRVYD